LVAGCGGGGGGSNSTTTTVASSPSATTSSASSTSSSELSETIETITTTTSAEQQSGDETPISTQALFTGRGGVITPRRIRVPPFIAVTVVLQSADGKQYSLSVKGRMLQTTSKASLRLSGLRAGSKYVLTTAAGSLTIVANAEPGP
jgi:hypothetical protein